MTDSSQPTKQAIARAPIDVWVGTSLGVLKGVCLSSKQSTRYLPGSLTLTHTDKKKEVCVMCWEHCSQDTLYCGRRDGIVQQFSCRDRVFTAECDCTGGSGEFVGLGKHEKVLITCTDRGSLSYWPPDSDKMECHVGNSVSCMEASPNTLLQVATGGKENDLKVWDGNKLDKPIFQAKNVKNDKLDLRVPVWVTRLGFIPGCGDQPSIVVGTGYHQVRLYDTRVQRRPVQSTDFGEHPVTALTVNKDGRSCFVGNSVGEMAKIDVRTGGVVNRYRGFAGGVRCIQQYSDGSQSLLAACGLDRYLRVYSEQPPKLLHQVYLKLQSSCLLFSNESSQVATEQGVEKVTRKEKAEEEVCPDSGSSDEEDQVWNEMETVQEKPTNKKRSRGDKHGETKQLTKRQKLRTKN